MDLADDPDIDDYPPKLTQIIHDLATINRLLRTYDATNEPVHMKQAAIKIKNGAPILKGLSNDETVKESPELQQVLQRCKTDMRALFERAKQLKGLREQKSKLDLRAPIKSASSDEESAEKEVVVEDDQEDLKAEEEQLRKQELEIEARRKELEKFDQNKMSQRKSEMEARKKEMEQEALANRRKEHQKKVMERTESIRASENDKEQMLARLEEENKVQETEVHTHLIKIKSTKSTFKKDNDLWSKIITDKEEKGVDKNNLNEDYTIVFFGNKQSGKTTLITKFLEKNDSLNDSAAVEYTYGRRAKRFSTNQARDVVHAWELVTPENDPKTLAQLVNITITPETITNSVIALVLDLSRPSVVLENVFSWLDAIRNRVEDVFKLMKQNPEQSSVVDALRRRATHLYDKHADKSIMKPLGVPLLFIGTKYDAFQELEVTQRKYFTKALRYFAILNGASILFTSKDEDALTTRLKIVLNHFLFETKLTKNVVIEYNKPLNIPAGIDGLQQIGQLPIQGNATTLQAWKDSWSSTFHEAKKTEQATTQKQPEIAFFTERAVDSARYEKDRELEMYQKMSIAV